MGGREWLIRLVDRFGNLECLGWNDAFILVSFSVGRFQFRSLERGCWDRGMLHDLSWVGLLLERGIPFWLLEKVLFELILLLFGMLYLRSCFYVYVLCLN